MSKVQMGMWIAVFMFFAIVGPYSASADAGFRVVLTWLFVGAGAIWWYFKKTTPQWIIGMVEIAAGMASNYHQLSVMVANKSQYGTYDRVAFILAGIAVIGQGIKDLDESPSKPWMKKLPNDPTEQTTPSIQ